MKHGTQTAATSARHRIRFALLGLLTLAVLADGGFLLSPGPASGRTASVSTRTAAAGCGRTAATSCAGSPADAAVAAPPTVAQVPPRPAKTGPSPPSSPSASPRPTVSATGAASAQPSASASVSVAQGDTAAAQDDAAEAQVLALINQARSTAGLPALTVTSGLVTSSSAHNLLMAEGCGLSHQCPGEAVLGARETAAGVDWTAAGENIGDGGPVADASAAIAQMAVGLTQSMLDEKPPNDGHRLNILSSTFTHIGIAVYRDASGTVWLTQDFSN